MAAFSNSPWDPHIDPIVAPGPPNTGLHYTKSGRYVNQYGMYANVTAGEKKYNSPSENVLENHPIYSAPTAVKPTSTKPTTPTKPIVTRPTVPSGNNPLVNPPIVPKRTTAGTTKTTGTNYDQLLQDSIARQIALIKSLGGDMPNVDPTQYAQQTADAQYGGQIGNVQHQIDQVQPNSNINQHNISDWYGQALSDFNTGASNYKDALAKELSGQQDATQGFMEALGGAANPGNAGIAQNAQIALGGLLAQGNASNIYNQNETGIIPMTAAQKHLDETSRAAKLSSDLSAQMQGLQSDKGNLYNKTLTDSQQQQFANKLGLDQQRNASESGLQNSLLAQSLAPYKQAQSTANLLKSTQSASTSAANERYIEAKISALNNKAASGGFNLNKPADAGKFESTIKGLIAGPNGGLRTNPSAAYKQVVGLLSRYPALNTPQGQAFAESVFESVLNQSHAQKQYGGTTIGADGKIHMTGPKVK